MTSLAPARLPLEAPFSILRAHETLPGVFALYILIHADHGMTGTCGGMGSS